MVRPGHLLQLSVGSCMWVPKGLPQFPRHWPLADYNGKPPLLCLSWQLGERGAPGVVQPLTWTGNKTHWTTR